MILKADIIADRLAKSSPSDPFAIIPKPSLANSDASIDLRLGTWFLALRHASLPHVPIEDQPIAKTGPQLQGTGYEDTLTNSYYVPFGKEYYLHPRTFVLGSTLEWIRLPSSIAGYVIGKSSLGRHGLIIATATGVHPGFNGCLTLELRNIGGISIPLRPGMKICQLFLHGVDGNSTAIEDSKFSCSRRPMVTPIVLDEFARKLSNKP